MKTQPPAETDPPPFPLDREGWPERSVRMLTALVAALLLTNVALVIGKGVAYCARSTVPPGKSGSTMSDEEAAAWILLLNSPSDNKR
mgnify:CR=1 FL=1